MQFVWRPFIAFRNRIPPASQPIIVPINISISSCCNQPEPRQGIRISIGRRRVPCVPLVDPDATRSEDQLHVVQLPPSIARPQGLWGEIELQLIKYLERVFSRILLGGLWLRCYYIKCCSHLIFTQEHLIDDSQVRVLP